MGMLRSMCTRSPKWSVLTVAKYSHPLTE